MADTPREELAELSRLVATHLDWQRELGVVGIGAPSDVLLAPVATSAKAPVRPRGPAKVAPASTPAPTPLAPPVTIQDPAGTPTRFEMPSFMKQRKGGVVSEPPVAERKSVPPVGERASTPPPEQRASVVPPVAETRSSPVFELKSVPLEPVVQPTVSPFSLPAVEGEARTNALTVIQDEVAGCTSCRLAEGRTQTVFARGNPFATVAFVGEGPGRDEDLQGKPFVGAAGQLLDKIIAAMGLTENDVYICNVVKCRPPNNRVPAPDEMTSCGGYLEQQLALVRPKVIVALGKTAVGYLLGSTDSMTRLRGTWRDWNGIPLLPTWHPAYLLRQPEAKKDTWDDMKIVLDKLGRTVPKR